MLAGWSLLESGQTFLGGYGAARALDDGFLAGRPVAGLLWLAASATGIVLGGCAVRGVFAGLAGLVEPLRNGLVRRTVQRALDDALTDPARADSSSVSRLTGQTEAVRDGFAGVLLTLRSFVFTAVGALLGLGALAPVLLPFVLLPLALGIGLFLLTLSPMARWQRAFLDADEALAAAAGRACEGLRDITACGAGPRTTRELDALVTAEAAASRALARWSAARTGALGVAAHLPMLSLLTGAPWLLRNGVTAGALLGALTYLTQSLLPALNTLMTALGTAGTRLLVILDRLAGPTASPAPRPGTGGVPADRPVPMTTGTAHSRRSTPAPDVTVPCPPAVELRSVTFGYGGRPVLDRLDLTVRRGEHLAVVGPSGIGKSTLTALVAGMLTPGAGDVLVAGDTVVGRPARELADRRALVPQEAYVFSGSVRENICYLRPDATDEELGATLDALDLNRLVDGLGGPSAPVEPHRLSLGERQLLALARAHLSPAPLLLLDEATCHLSPREEDRAEAALAARPGTLIVVAHRLSSARRADRVLVLDGTHPTLGTHDELLTRSPLYRDLAGAWHGDTAH
ncbi:ABC transporter ATP-binding protein [Streptomyces niger]|uniref:ABC transporter ATP-binding protein n=1 Tax=Streptomyces niger TaxID=66373 RepID=UPI000ACA36A1|nr:ABC transporter ATP-binding protein [Streptomyces niger]